MRKYFFAILPFLVALAVRLYPTYMCGLPYSTDAWSPIRNAELLMLYTPHDLGDDTIFDGYNNYWPANSLFGVIVSQLTGLEPMRSMSILVPFAGAVTILIFYVLVKRFYSPEISLVASLIFATTYPHVVFTAGVTKETYANPLYLLAIFAFLHPTISDHKRIILFSLSSLTLVLAHHYTTLIAIVVLLSVVAAQLVRSVKTGHEYGKSKLLLTTILILVAALYYGLYAYRGFPYTVSHSDLLSFLSYHIIAFALAASFISRPRLRIIITGFLVSSAALLTILAIRVPLIPGVPVPPTHLSLFSLPLMLALSLVPLGYKLHKRDESHIAPVFWLSSILAIACFSIFANSSVGIALAYRTGNFLWPPLAILSAAGLYRLCKAGKKTYMPKPTKLLAVTIFSAMIVINLYSVYVAVSLQDRHMFPVWLYKTPEYEAAAWTAVAANSRLVAGDVKVRHLMTDYFGMVVDSLQGFRYLMGKGSTPEVLFFYNQMLRNGYMLDRSMDLPENYLSRVNDLNRVCSNGLVNIYTE